MTTSGKHVRKRHATSSGMGAAGATSRATHGMPGFDPRPTDPYYGAQIDYEMIDVVDLPGGIIDGETHILPGSIIAETFDPTPPAAPTGLTLTSSLVAASDGGTYVDIEATLVQPTDSDLLGSLVEITSLNDGAEVPSPVWTRPYIVQIAAGSTKTTFHNAAGSTMYWARARAVDRTGNYSAYSSTTSHVTVKDASAPPIPSGVTLTAGFRGFTAYWVPTTVPDIMFYEYRHAPNLAGAPDTAQWVYAESQNTTIWVGDRVPDAMRWFQVRAVDVSGNVDNGSGVAVDFQANPESGWTAALSVIPLAVGQDDIAAGAISAARGHIADLDADAITTGTLVVRSGFGAGVEVRTASNVLVIDMNDDGSMYFIDEADPDKFMYVDSGTLYFTLDGGLTPIAALGPNGLNASIINFGGLPNGQNMIWNSSFEMAASVGADSVLAHTLGTEWTTAEKSNTNVSKNTNDLTVTALAY